MTTYTAVIAAAGKSTRLTTGQGAAGRKQFAPINGKAVLWHAAQPFLRHPDIAQVRIVVDGIDAAKLAARMFDDKRVRIMTGGGETRAATVANGIADLAADIPVVIHDAARPCLTDDSLAELLAAVGESEGGGLLAVPAFDALKRSFAGKVRKTLSRNNKWQAQTPQVFRAGLLLPALKAHPHAMDDSAAMVKAGFAPLIVRGRADNIKITDAADLQFAAVILSARPAGGDKIPAAAKPAAVAQKPATAKPAATQKPAAAKPATKPAAKKPAATKPAAKKPAKGEKKQ